MSEEPISQAIEARAQANLEVALWRRISAQQPCQPGHGYRPPKKVLRRMREQQAERQRVLAAELAKFDAEVT